MSPVTWNPAYCERLFYLEEVEEIRVAKGVRAMIPEANSPARRGAVSEKRGWKRML